MEVKVKGELNQDRMCFELVRNLPAEMEGFFEMSSYDLDVSQTILNSPTHTIFSTSDSVSP